MILIVIASIFLYLGEPILVASTNTNGHIQPGYLFDGGLMGDRIEIWENPAMALIQYNELLVCAGSIISQSTILTTFKCTDKNLTGLTVRVGTSIANEGGSYHKVIAIRHHESYQKLGDMVVNDVTLVKVSPPFRFGPSVRLYVSPISLVNENDVITPYTIIKIDGWKTERPNDTMVLRRAILHVVQCKINDTISNIALSPQFCAVPHYRDMTEVCQGNLGSPIIALGRQVGIISQEEGCVSNHNPMVFTHLAGYHDWIDANVKIMEKITPLTELDTFFKHNVLYRSLPFWKW